MNTNAIRLALHCVNDPFDIYEAFVLNTPGSPEEQVHVWKQHLGIDTALDYYLRITMCVREYCDNQRRNSTLDVEIDALWNTIIDASHASHASHSVSHGVSKPHKLVVDLT